MKLFLISCLIVIGFLTLGFSDNYKINSLERKIRSLESNIGDLERKVRSLESDKADENHDHDFNYARRNHDHDSDYADEYHTH